MKNILSLVGFIATSFVILLLVVRGNPGNPTARELISKTWIENGPFELSPERGRFALTYSLIENKSFSFRSDIARFVVPDLGYINGKYVSLFAPGVSFVVIPGYIIGKIFGVSQIGTFLIITFFSLLNMVLIYAIAKLLGANDFAAKLAGLSFLFATPAFNYATTLYQHHISTFAILLCLYLLIRFDNWKSYLATFFLYGVAFTLDYPNALLMFPIVIFTSLNSFGLQGLPDKISLKINIFKASSIIGVLIPLVVLFGYNQKTYGNFRQLAGTVADVQDIDIYGNPILEKSEERPAFDKFGDPIVLKKKTAVGFFDTRNLINGVYTHLISPDRGVVIFTPIVLLGILGFSILYRKNPRLFSLLFSVIAINLILYSLWGDPWGGWAFGSRYLIPSYALLSIFFALYLSTVKKTRYKVAVSTAVYLILIYSLAVNTLGAVTNHSNPPRVEAANLQSQSGKVQRYTFGRNIDLLYQNESRSFMYRNFLKDYMPLSFFYLLIFTTLTAQMIYYYTKATNSDSGDLKNAN